MSNDKQKWNIHRINDDGTIGPFLDSGLYSKGDTAEEALEAGAAAKYSGMYKSGQSYLVTCNRGELVTISAIVEGAKILKLEAPSPKRVAKPVTF